ncbi:EAL domain-containing protein [Photobacterium damselae]|uniref:GGDEF and EAL domain-containing protein n=2 Tax=Photobacterium damselae TaxID=38293 RepID=D0Z3Y7_PHODD|nr:GGDEF domain-containing protein [Photobacterium damselae]EEZ40118.1 GGDEF and EAL domain-containing protein [Photobacterium damselae subsp. damselae CIP 102761]PSW84929.1 GGDEF domain-containing protein [Photobacterium damselae]SPY44292.1 Regulator of CsrB and CsrC decay CsrD [Photobacterium damselae]
MSLYKKQIINIASIFTLTIGALTINQVATDRDLIAISEKLIIKSELQLIRNYLLTTPSLTEKNLTHIESDIGQLISHENFSHIEISIDDQQIKWLSPIEPKSLSYQFVTAVFPETDYSISEKLVTPLNNQIAIKLVSSSSNMVKEKNSALIRILFANGTILLFGLGSLYWFTRREFNELQQVIQHLTKNPQSPLPMAKNEEFKIITKAFNSLITQLNLNFQAQAKEALKLKEQAYKDPISLLGNRSFFIHQLNSWLQESSKGGVILSKLQFVDDYYQKEGYQIGDQLIKEIATYLEQAVRNTNATVARLSYDEFAILIPSETLENLKLIGENILLMPEQLKLDEELTLNQTRIGIVLCSEPTTTSNLLAQLDNSLAQAASTPEHPIYVTTDITTKAAFGKQQWKQILLDAIEKDNFSYQYQSVQIGADQIYHYEIFTAIHDSTSRYSANQFLNAIEDLSLGSLFDRNVIIHAINTLLAKKQMPPIAINLTTNSINDPAFVRWLTTTLDTNKNLSHRLYFEIPESCCVRHFDATSILCSTIRFHHFGIGIDNYGRYFQSLNYLQELRPDYVKIDFVYTNQLNDPTKANVLSSICRTAHSLNIKTIATRVETETQKERLSDLFITGFQGFVIEKGITEEKIIA